MVSTVVDVFCAIFPGESGHAVASVMGKMVDAFSPVFAGGKLVGAKGDFGLAKVAGKAAAADAGVLADAVDTSGVVLKEIIRLVKCLVSCPLKLFLATLNLLTD
jgi:hypothetical protein